MFYSAVQKKVISRVVLSCLSLLPLSAASVILLSLSLTPSAPLTFKSHSSSRSLTPLYNRVRTGGVVCVCLWVGGPRFAAPVRLSLIAGVVLLKSSRKPSGAGGGKLNKHHPSKVFPLRAVVRLPCLPATQLSSAPGEPCGTTHSFSEGTEGGLGRRAMVEHRGEKENADRVVLCEHGGE